MLSAALPEMMVGLERAPLHLGQGMPTRVLTTKLFEELYWSGVDAVLASPDSVWAESVQSSRSTLLRTGD